MACLADRLLELREEKQLNQCELSKILGMSVTTYNGWELGKREPKIESIRMLADFYKVSTDYICGYSNYKDNEQPKSSNQNNRFKAVYNDLPINLKKPVSELMTAMQELIINTVSNNNAKERLRAYITAVDTLSEYNSAIKKNALDSSIDGYISARSEAQRTLDDVLDTIARCEVE